LAHRITDPIIVPAALWQRPETIDALRSRDMRRLFHLLRKYAGASQTRIGIACGLAQPKISAIMNGTHQVEKLEVFERIADGLDMPREARLAMGLAPSALDLTSRTVIPPRDGHNLQAPGPTPGTLIVGSPSPSEVEDPVLRRTFTRLAGASLVGTVLADNAATGPLHGAEAFAAALVSPESVPAAAQPTEVPALAKAVANAKRAYQSCRYAEVMSQMPTLLPTFRPHAATSTVTANCGLTRWPPTPTMSRPASCSNWTTMGSPGWPPTGACGLPHSARTRSRWAPVPGSSPTP